MTSINICKKQNNPPPQKKTPQKKPRCHLIAGCVFQTELNRQHLARVRCVMLMTVFFLLLSQSSLEHVQAQCPQLANRRQTIYLRRATGPSYKHQFTGHVLQLFVRLSNPFLFNSSRHTAASKSANICSECYLLFTLFLRIKSEYSPAHRHGETELNSTWNQLMCGVNPHAASDIRP